MPEPSQRENLLRDQYQNASNLNARIQLHQRFSVNKQDWQEWVFEQLDLPPAGRLLEIGCGPGNLWRQNAARIPAGLEMVLTDFSEGMLAETRRNLAGLSNPPRYTVADAHHVPFAEGSFDVVIANHMLYYVADRPKTFTAIRRVLRPGGRFYASTVGQTHMQEIGDLIARFDPTIDYDSGLTYFSQGSPFYLEGGQAELEPWFEAVELRRFDDALLVTEVEPLVAYIISMDRLQPRIADRRRAELPSFVERELETQGAIRITKDSGLFIANRGDD